MKLRVMVVASFVTGALAGAMMVIQGCRPAPPEATAAERAIAQDPSPPVPVRLSTVASGPVDRPIHGTGTVRSKNEADLSFKVGGVVSAVLVDEGARVRKGQILARLDPTEVGAALRQANESAAKAERDLSRVRSLHASGAVPIADLQNAETALSMARAGVDAASFNAQRSAIVAPDDGRIERRTIEPGEVVSPGRPAFHVSGRSQGAIVRIALVDRDVLRVREGDEASVVLDARPDVPLAGRVSQIATVATPGVGTCDIEVRIDGTKRHDARPNGDLPSGLTAKVEIRHLEEVAGIVPIASLVDGHGADAAVFVVDQGHARRVPVRVAFLLDERAALAVAPLQPRASIVEAGATQLEDGSPVRVLP